MLSSGVQKQGLGDVRCMSWEDHQINGVANAEGNEFGGKMAIVTIKNEESPLVIGAGG